MSVRLYHRGRTAEVVADRPRAVYGALHVLATLDVLRTVDIGNGVAEFDDALEKYFVETETFRTLATGNSDIVSGDKGTGKTALYRILKDRYTTLPELQAVEIVPAFNVTGSPVFQRLVEGDPYSESQYMTLWKGYFISLAGNWLLTLYDGELTDAMFDLHDLLERTGLRSLDDSPTTIFSTIFNLFRRLTHPKAAEMAITISPQGLPVVIPKLEFGDADEQLEPNQMVRHEVAFELLNRCLGEIGLELWLVMDRLDEAFAGLPDAEVPALRALLRTYLDLQAWSNVRLKLFLRNDLFRRIIEGGFVNLTHINARKVEIRWDEESLRDVLERRLRESADLTAALNISVGDSVFDAIFPAQVDLGSRKPATWTWMMGRVRDGNYVRPPRNLIDLVQKSLDDAIRREERDRTPFARGKPIIRSESIKAGLGALSKQRVEDTLLAEAGSLAHLVDEFRSGKAEHNEASVSKLLGQEGDDLRQSIDFLKEIGFLESSGGSLKIPILYRDGLGITQGKRSERLRIPRRRGSQTMSDTRRRRRVRACGHFVTPGVEAWYDEAASNASSRCSPVPTASRSGPLDWFRGASSAE